jgi:hypothetical protein
MFEMQVTDGSGRASTQDRFIATSERLFMVVVMTTMTVTSMTTTTTAMVKMTVLLEAVKAMGSVGHRASAGAQKPRKSPTA